MEIRTTYIKNMNNILKFFVKRVFVFYLIALFVCFFVKYHRLHMMIALTVSVLFALLRLVVLEAALRQFGVGTNKRVAIVFNLVLYLFNLAIIAITTILALHMGVYTLIAALAGTLSVMIIIVLNVITEALGITKNQFGQKVNL